MKKIDDIKNTIIDAINDSNKQIMNYSEISQK